MDASFDSARLTRQHTSAPMVFEQDSLLFMPYLDAERQVVAYNHSNSPVVVFRVNDADNDRLSDNEHVARLFSAAAAWLLDADAPRVSVIGTSLVSLVGDTALMLVVEE